jgi:hypothetical protein
MVERAGKMPVSLPDAGVQTVDLRASQRGTKPPGHRGATLGQGNENRV